MLVGVAVVAGAILVVSALTVKPKLGPDNCPAEVTQSTVIVMDRSDNVGEQTIAEMSSRGMQYVRDHVAPAGRVSVFTISRESERSLRPLFSACRPPQSGNRFIENEKAIEKNYLTTFEEPLSRILREPPRTSDESPIAQTFTDLSLSEYLRSKSNNLLVFSDLLENTKAFSLYHCVEARQAIQAFRASRRGAMERPQFRNTAVVLNLIPRLELPSETIACRDKFWNWFFGADDGQNATLTGACQ